MIEFLLLVRKFVNPKVEKMTAVEPIKAQKNMDAEVQYAEFVIAWNVKMLLTAQGKSQSALAAFLGIQRPTMTNKMKGRIAWSVADVVKSADFLGTTVEALMDDSLMSQLQAIGNKKATGDTPMASGELLRLGLNQRPSDIRFGFAAIDVGLFATGVNNTPALLFLQIGVSSRMFTLQLVFRRASARTAQ